MRKTFIYYSIICLTLLFCQACHNKQTEQTIEYQSYEQPDTTCSVQRMKDYHYHEKIEDGNVHFSYDITRKADETLPTITSEDNMVFADNYIRLKISKGDTEILNKTFTKQTFKPFIDQDFYNKSILEGMAFHKIDGKNLRFVSSISYPETDMFILCAITIAPDGTYSITKEDNLEMN